MDINKAIMVSATQAQVDAELMAKINICSANSRVVAQFAACE